MEVPMKILNKFLLVFFAISPITQGVVNATEAGQMNLNFDVGITDILKQEKVMGCLVVGSFFGGSLLAMKYSDEIKACGASVNNWWSRNFRRDGQTQGKTGMAATLAVAGAATYLKLEGHSVLAGLAIGVPAGLLVRDSFKIFDYKRATRNLPNKRTDLERKIFQPSGLTEPAIGLAQWVTKLNTGATYQADLRQLRLAINELYPQYSENLSDGKEHFAMDLKARLADRKEELLELEKQTGLMQLIHSSSQWNTQVYSLECVSELLACKEDECADIYERVINHALEQELLFKQVKFGRIMHGWFKGPSFNALVDYHWKLLQEYATLDFVYLQVLPSVNLKAQEPLRR
jgi:hypothetical protein